MARIVEWTPDLADATVDMLSRAFATNPLHVGAFGPDVSSKNRAFFEVGLGLFRGRKIVAIEDGRVVGFAHWVDSPGCRLSPWKRASLVPAMLRGFGIGSTRRVGAWLSAWAANDPAEPHSHLGPIGVDPGMQARGIGRLLMDRYCATLDEAAATGYLETDKPENVPFYRRSGFEVIREGGVIGATSWYMSRPRRT